MESNTQTGLLHVFGANYCTISFLLHNSAYCITSLEYIIGVSCKIRCMHNCSCLQNWANFMGVVAYTAGEFCIIGVGDIIGAFYIIHKYYIPDVNYIIDAYSIIGAYSIHVIGYII